MNALLDAIARGPVLCDGAMGTQLQLAGLEPGGCGEAWNLDKPAAILAIQRAYVEAGAQVLLSNTFGASRIMLARHGESRVVEINRAGARLAREAFGDRPGLVLGDIGPFGGLLAPLGDGDPDAVSAAFREQAQALLDGGVDGILIETQTALEELGLAIDAARAAGAQVVIGSVAFDRMRESDDVRTMMGVSPEQAAEFMEARGVDVVALNCGAEVDMVLGASIAARYRECTDLPILAQINAGTPTLVGEAIVYHQSPDDMAAGVPALIAAGANLVGGCCGSTPAHIAAFRRILDT